MVDDEVNGAVHGALIFLNGFSGFLAKLLAAFSVGKEVGEGLFEFGGVLDLHDGLAVEEDADDVGEVLHVGAEDDGLAEAGGFDGILTTLGGEAFADEDDGGVGVKGGEFAGGVDDEGLDGTGGAAGLGGDVAAIFEFDVIAGKGVADFAVAFEMAGDEDEEKIGETLAQAGELLGKDEFLAGVGAAGDEEGSVGRDADLREERGDIEGFVDLNRGQI